MGIGLSLWLFSEKLRNHEKFSQQVASSAMPSVSAAEADPSDALLAEASNEEIVVSRRFAATNKLLAIADEEHVADALKSLGSIPFPRAQAFWEALLRDTSRPADFRAAGAEALANSTPEAQALLRDLAIGDPESQVRANAAWSLSVLGNQSPYGPEIAKALTREDDPTVRRRLYEALLVQNENPSASMLSRIESENNLATTVAALNAYGDAVGRSGNVVLERNFDQKAVPELVDIAGSDESLNLRMRAVFALRRASTPGAIAALAKISQSGPVQVARAAANGLEIQHP